jgi:hypothetical protein
MCVDNALPPDRVLRLRRQSRCSTSSHDTLTPPHHRRHHVLLPSYAVRRSRPKRSSGAGQNALPILPRRRGRSRDRSFAAEGHSRRRGHHRRDCRRDRPAGLRESRHAADPYALCLSGVDARRRVRLDDDRRRGAHCGANQGARESGAGVRSRQARRQERIPARAESSERVHDEARQRPARRHHHRRTEVHRAARADRRHLRVRLPDGRRSSLLRNAGESGIIGRRVRQGAVHA